VYISDLQAPNYISNDLCATNHFKRIERTGAYANLLT
jgi:hypothetical protein